MEFTTSMLLLLLLFSCGAGNVACSTTTLHGNETDRLSLLNFKQAISSDPRGALSSWNMSVHFCSWKGVTCSLKHQQRITSLKLDGQGLVGYISPSLGNLTFLQVLSLPENGFTGGIPPSLGYLRRLQTLNLNDNPLQGKIPDELSNCSSLSGLGLYNNQLVGGIPPTFGALLKLRHLLLSLNSLTGTILPSLGNITTLEKFAAAKNHLEGSIPNELGGLSRMIVLGLGENKLSGRIPPSLFNLSSLMGFSLPLNQFDRARLPVGIGDTLPNLQVFNLVGNKFEGPIPASLGNASGLAKIHLSSNKFTGSVPIEFGNLPYLDSLNLENNQLESSSRESRELFDALSNCTRLEELELDGNQLRGVIPNTVGNLSTHLQFLLLGGNQLSGTIPNEISKLHALIQLGLDVNNFTGTVVDWVGNLENLQSLHLDGNHFTGPIPASLGNLSQLSNIYVGGNEFDGHIPPSLGSLKHLLTLDLRYNNFQGSVPKEIFGAPSLIKCMLSYNNLDGALPVELGSAQHLSELYLSSNKLSGEIPSAIGNCQDLEIIQMDRNFLTGNITATLSNLKSLRALNLSYNNLSGGIPESLDSLQYLQQLDLSYNHLTGEVPQKGAFMSATVLSLDGNWGLCGGVLQLGLPPCPVHSMSSKRRQTHHLLQIVIPIVGFILLVALVSFLLLRRKKSQHKSRSIPSFGTQFPQVSYRDLAKATEDFSPSNLLGRGRYGSVYEGKLFQAQIEVAVKVFNLEMQGAERSFMAECAALRSIRHRNLIAILTACSSVDARGNDFKALVYELMPKGNLDTWLHSKDHTPSFLSLSQSLDVAVDIAVALEYLHHNCGTPIIHCDLKPSNILLDDDMSAHVGDFGLARFFIDRGIGVSSSASSIGVKGTIGYVAPEYATGNEISTSGDVYSFGIILLEMLTGKRPTDELFRDSLTIVKFVEMNFPDYISQVVDPQLQDEGEDFIGGGQHSSNTRIHDCLLSVLQIGLSCTHQFPSERMNMREVAVKMHEIRGAYLGGTLQGV